MKKDSKIYVAGHTGLVGSAVLRELAQEGYSNVVTRTHKELDLCVQSDVSAFFKLEKPEYVIIAAAKVGGIGAHCRFGADFITENLQIETNAIHQSHKNHVKKLLLIGSSCVYPRLAPQPMAEDCLFTGKLEPTTEPYAVAKIAGLVMCKAYKKQYGDDFVSVMPSNLYGPGDNFDLDNSNVLPAMIRKFHDSKAKGFPHVTLWGTGSARREFLHVDDLANAVIHIMNNYEGEAMLNIGTGKDITIKDLALMVKGIVGYTGEIVWDTSKPDGIPRKLLDITRIRATGWEPRIELRDGIKETYRWFLQSSNCPR